MTIRIGSKRFPDTFDEILNDKVFSTVFSEFLKKRSAFENIQFYRAVERGASNSSLYQHFIWDRARKSINVSSATRAPMDNLAAQNDFDDPSWSGLLNTAKKDIYLLMEANFYTDFFKSDHYLALMERKIIPTITSVPNNLMTSAKLKDNKGLMKDKNLLACVKYTKMAAVLKEKGHPKANGVKSIASRQLETLAKKHKFTMKYDMWQKLVSTSM